MVWAMRLPGDFGKYWPGGSFAEPDEPGGYEDWYWRLRSRFQNDLTDEEKAKYNLQGEKWAEGLYKSSVVDSFTREHGTRMNERAPVLRSIEPDEAPKYFTLRGSARKFGDLIKLNDRIIACSGRLIDLIERLEPKVHQSFPIELRAKDGRLLSADYHTVIIRNYRDSFVSDPERLAKDFPVFSKPSSTALTMDARQYRKFRFEGEKILGAHLWRERFFNEKLTFFSDELHNLILEHGLDLPKLHQMTGSCYA